MEHPIESQREVLQDLVTSAQYTEFGRNHRFSKLFSLRAFKEAVPIQTYEDLKPYIERIMHGEQNLLWNTPIHWFAKSSGTTSDKSKFIPVSQESLEDCHFKAAKDVLTHYYHFNPDSDLLTGKGLVIGGSHSVNQLNEETHYGDLIALMDEWESKIEKLAHSTIQENVTSISGVPTWTLVLFRRILEITGKRNIKEVWPHLELYLHGGVSFVPYREQFRQLIGEDIHYLEMYNASEGFFAAQDRPGEDGMLLFTDHGIFMEFMPVEAYGKAHPQTIGLGDVEIGKHYAPVISTNGGLWRYLIGDTVQFTSLFPFRIRVSGRLKHFINAFGEELIVDNAEQAIAIASRQTGAVVRDYTAGPVYFSNEGNGAHEWLLEFERAPSSLEHFAYELDQALKACNSDYEAKRHRDIALRMPVIVNLPEGSFSQWLKARNKLGGQHKIPRLSNDRSYIEEIRRMIPGLS
jgi:hypothetical protein